MTLFLFNFTSRMNENEGLDYDLSNLFDPMISQSEYLCFLCSIRINDNQLKISNLLCKNCYEISYCEKLN